MEVPISENGIERCHILGRPNAKGNRPIIVKFKSYKTKAAVFNAKNKRKKNPDKMFVTENLTSKNHSIVQKLVELLKNGTPSGPTMVKSAPKYLKSQSLRVSAVYPMLRNSCQKNERTVPDLFIMLFPLRTLCLLDRIKQGGFVAILLLSKLQLVF